MLPACQIFSDCHWWTEINAHCNIGHWILVHASIMSRNARSLLQLMAWPQIVQENIDWPTEVRIGLGIFRRSENFGFRFTPLVEMKWLTLQSPFMIQTAWGVLSLVSYLVNPFMMQTAEGVLSRLSYPVKSLHDDLYSWGSNESRALPRRILSWYRRLSESWVSRLTSLSPFMIQTAGGVLSLVPYLVESLHDTDGWGSIESRALPRRVPSWCRGGRPAAPSATRDAPPGAPSGPSGWCWTPCSWDEKRTSRLRS